MKARRLLGVLGALVLVAAVVLLALRFGWFSTATAPVILPDTTALPTGAGEGGIGGATLAEVTPETVQAVVRTLAARSMEIYYCHVLVLTWLRRAPLPQTGTRGMLVLLLTTALLSTALAWPLSALKKTAVPHPLTKLSS